MSLPNVTLLINARYIPSLCAMANFSYQLIESLKDKGQNVIPLIFDRSVVKKTNIITFDINSKNDLCRQIQNISTQYIIESIILHYVQYDMHTKAIPYRLLTGLRKFKKQFPKLKIILSIHELILPQIARKKEILYYPFQFLIIKSILCLADHVIVTTPVLEKRARRIHKDFQSSILPVFSGFDEPEIARKDLSAKDPTTWIIFGSAGRIIYSLKKFIDFYIDRKIYCDKLIIAGGKASYQIKILLSEISGITYTYIPEISVEGATELMKTASFSILDYDECENESASHIFRSSVFGTCLANAIIPVVPSICDKPTLKTQKKGSLFVFTKNNFPKKNMNHEQITEQMIANYQWYHSNMSKAIHAKTISKIINNS